MTALMYKMFVKHHDARILKVIAVCILNESTRLSSHISGQKLGSHLKEDGTKHF